MLCTQSNNIYGHQKLERRVLKSQETGMSVEAPEQLRLPSREVYQTAVDGCMHADGSSELGDIFSLEAFIGIRTDKTTPQFTPRQEFGTLPMRQQLREVKLSGEQHKQLDPGR